MLRTNSESEFSKHHTKQLYPKESNADQERDLDKEEAATTDGGDGSEQE